MYTGNMRRKTISYIYLALCILSWGMIPVVSKKMLVELDNLQILFYSTIFSMLIMLVVLVFQNKIGELSKYSLRSYLNMSFLGFLGVYLYYVLLYKALSLTSASEGFILAYTWPILVLLLAFLILREKFTFKKLFSVLISFLGIIVIVTHGNPSSLNFTNAVGDLLAIIGAGVFATFSVLGKKYNYDQAISVFVYFVAATIFLIPTILLTSTFKMPSLEIWYWVLLNGLFINGISNMFWFKALQYGDTHIISSALYLTPFLSLVYIHLFLGENILFSSAIGLMIIVTGVILQSINLRRLKS